MLASGHKFALFLILYLFFWFVIRYTSVEVCIYFPETNWSPCLWVAAGVLFIQCWWWRLYGLWLQPYRTAVRSEDCLFESLYSRGSKASDFLCGYSCVINIVMIYFDFPVDCQLLHGSCSKQFQWCCQNNRSSYKLREVVYKRWGWRIACFQVGSFSKKADNINASKDW